MFFLIKIIGHDRYLSTDTDDDPDYGVTTEYYFMRPVDMYSRVGKYNRLVVFGDRVTAEAAILSEEVINAKERYDAGEMEIVELVSINKIIEDELLS